MNDNTGYNLKRMCDLETFENYLPDWYTQNKKALSAFHYLSMGVWKTMKRSLTKLVIVLSTVLLLSGCAPKKVKSIFEGISLDMNRDEVHKLLGEPETETGILKDYQRDDEERYIASLLGLSGDLVFYYDKDQEGNESIRNVIWYCFDRDHMISEKEKEIKGIIDFYSGLYGEPKTGYGIDLDENMESAIDKDQKVYEWKDTFLNYINLELENYEDNGGCAIRLVLQDHSNVKD